MSKLSEHVKKYNNGDIGAFDDIYALMYRKVYLTAMQYMKDHGEAEDATQDVFIAAMQKIKNIADPASAVAWFSVVTRNVCLNKLRKNTDALLGEDGEYIMENIKEESSYMLPEETVMSKEKSEIILNLVGMLPLAQREALMLMSINGLSISQVAKVTGANEGTVKSRVSYGKARLRELVEECEKKDGVKLRGFLPLFLLPMFLRSAAESAPLQIETADKILIAAKKAAELSTATQPSTALLATSAKLTVVMKAATGIAAVGIVAALAVAVGTANLSGDANNPEHASNPASEITSIEQDADAHTQNELGMPSEAESAAESASDDLDGGVNSPDADVPEPGHPGFDEPGVQATPTPAPAPTPVPARATTVASTANQYTVLALDISNSMGETALAAMKSSAKSFVNSLGNESHFIAIVPYSGQAHYVNNGRGGYFFDAAGEKERINYVIDNIDSLDRGGTNIYEAFYYAYALLTYDEVPERNVVKNILFFTDGMPESGERLSSGRYGINDTERYKQDDSYIYEYANAVYDIVKNWFGNINIYTLGFFQDFYDEQWGYTAQDLAFARRFLNDLQNSGYWDIEVEEDIILMFEEIVSLMIDTDGDGLPDVWETEGVEIEGTFFPLHEWGCDPEVKDIFIEIDWTEAPVRDSNSGKITGTKPDGYKPSHESLRLIYEVFKNSPVDNGKGIQIHIDAGPDSIDFVTGRPWGSASGASSIAHSTTWVGTAMHEWMPLVDDNFSISRRAIFRYCIFTEAINLDVGNIDIEEFGSFLLGRANDIPSQFFLVAQGLTSGAWLTVRDDTGPQSTTFRISFKDFGYNDPDFHTAAVFVHELGHVLGLGHGGTFDKNEGSGREINVVGCHENNSKEYLSIMNYLYGNGGGVEVGNRRVIDYSRTTARCLAGHTTLVDWDNLNLYGGTIGNIAASLNPLEPEIFANPVEEPGYPIDEEVLEYLLENPKPGVDGKLLFWLWAGRIYVACIIAYIIVRKKKEE